MKSRQESFIFLTPNSILPVHNPYLFEAVHCLQISPPKAAKHSFCLPSVPHSSPIIPSFVYHPSNSWRQLQSTKFLARLETKEYFWRSAPDNTERFPCTGLQGRTTRSARHSPQTEKRAWQRARHAEWPYIIISSQDPGSGPPVPSVVSPTWLQPSCSRRNSRRLEWAWGPVVYTGRGHAVTRSCPALGYLLS